MPLLVKSLAAGLRHVRSPPIGVHARSARFLDVAFIPYRQGRVLEEAGVRRRACPVTGSKRRASTTIGVRAREPLGNTKKAVNIGWRSRSPQANSKLSISHHEELLAEHHDIPIAFLLIAPGGPFQTHLKLGVETFLEFAKKRLAILIRAIAAKFQTTATGLVDDKIGWLRQSFFSPSFGKRKDATHCVRYRGLGVVREAFELCGVKSR